MLDLGSFDVILGVDWMKSFNPVLFDFEASRIVFKRDGKIIRLQGMTDAAKEYKMMPCVDFQQLMHKNGSDFQTPHFCIEVFAPQTEEEQLFAISQQEDMPDELKKLLEKYKGNSLRSIKETPWEV